ncbi:MAG: hypothetical protein U0R76_01985 [Candidatus Nanopelagicales bacterium]
MSDRDDELERRLRALATEADPPPELVVESAKAAFALRDLDASSPSWSPTPPSTTRASSPAPSSPTSG